MQVGSDAQAIAGWSGPGPYKIVNNYLEGSTENLIFGGAGNNSLMQLMLSIDTNADPVITNLVPSDIEVRNNYFFKPLSWKQDDPSYAGMHWAVKNIFELK